MVSSRNTHRSVLLCEFVYIGGQNIGRTVRLNLLQLILISLIIFMPALSMAAEQYSYVTQWGSQVRDDGQFDRPTGVAVDSSNTIYVVDMGNNRIQKFTSTGTYVTKWGTSGSENIQFENPFDIAIDSSDSVYA